MYWFVKRNLKNVCFKNRDFKKGVWFDNILYVINYIILFVRNKRLNIFWKRIFCFFWKENIWIKEKKRIIVIDFG